MLKYIKTLSINNVIVTVFIFLISQSTVIHLTRQYTLKTICIRSLINRNPIEKMWQLNFDFSLVSKT